MPHPIDRSRNMLFGLLALQTGLINQAQLVAAFHAWTQAMERPMAEIMAEQGAMEAPCLTLVEGLVIEHLRRHGNDPERSLAAIGVGRSTHECLARIGNPELDASLAHVGTGSTEHADDPDRTANYSVGSATSDGQRFRILRPHAKGGLGAVFVALDTELHREVALKQILDSHADDSLSRQRFLVEAEVTGGLEHPGIVPVYGLGVYGDGRPYYAMRFIRGDSLKEAIERFHTDEGWKSDPGKRSLELRKLLRRFTDVCNAIEYAHSRGVLHRDLKPGNVIVGKHGETLVVDWGLAKATGKSDPTSGERTLMPSSASGSSETLPGSALGTPAYMSPEQAEGQLDRLGVRSDVYSLGATLYCLLTGKPPLEGDVADVIRAVQRGEFRPPCTIDPSIDRALEAVCLKAMAMRPEDRYISCRALAEDIERWMADEPISAWREPLSRRARRWARRNRSLVTGAAAAVMAGVVGLGAVLAVQTRAKADLARSLASETQANHRLAAANADLARSQAAVQARYDLAVDAIETFHTGVSEDFLLKEDQFKRLRDRLLTSASDFYGRLGALLGKESDQASRRALAQANFEVAELTTKVGQSEAALAAHRQVLAYREALAAEAGADAEVKADVGRSLTAMADLLAATGQSGEALATYRKAEGLLADLAGLSLDSASARSALAACRSQLGGLQHQTGHAGDGLAVLRLARADQETLASAAGAAAETRADLAAMINRIGTVLRMTGKLAEAEAEHRQALVLLQQLVDDHPAVTEFRYRLATGHGDLAALLSPNSRQAPGTLLPDMSRSAEAAAEYRHALVTLQRLVDENPAVTQFRRDVETNHHNLAIVLEFRGLMAESEAEYRRALAITQKLADEHPERFYDRKTLARIHHNLGCLYSVNDRLDEAEASLKQAIGIWEQLTTEHPDLVEFALGLSLAAGEMASSRRRRGDLQGDYDWLRRAGRTVDDILRRAPDFTRARKRLAFGLSYFTKACARLGRHAEAIDDCDRLIKLLDGEDRDRARIQRVLAIARSGDYARAAVEADRLAGTTSIPVGERSFGFACVDAVVSAAIRNDPKLNPAERSKRSEQLAARSVLLLNRSLNAGFLREKDQNDRLVEESDLAPLRSRPDFQLLMMDLAMPDDPFLKAADADR